MCYKFSEVKMTIDDERIWASELTKASVRLNLDIVDVLTEAQRAKLLRELKKQARLYDAAGRVRLQMLRGSGKKHEPERSDTIEGKPE